MQIVRTADFERALKKFPTRIRTLCERQIGILKTDWRDMRLHLKKLKTPYEGIFSFRITRMYRAFFYFDHAGGIIIFDADNRKDAYR